MNDILLKLLQESTLIKDAMRQRILATADQLSPEQITKICALLKGAEEKKKAILIVQDQKIQKADEKYQEKMKEFLQKGLSKIRKKVEEKDKASESKKIKKLISNLNHI